MADSSTILPIIASQAPLVAAAVLAVMLYMERRLRDLEARIDDRIGKVESRIGGVEGRIGGLEGRVQELARSVKVLVEFTEALLSIQMSRGLLTDQEFRALSALLAVARPPHSSPYYTREVYERLGQLLQKDPNELTWDDVFELENIYELLIKEAEATGRQDLERYAAKLRVLIAMAKGILLRRGQLPPPGRVV